MKKPKKVRKPYERRYWNKMNVNSNPVKTDFSGVRSAYSYGSRNKIRFHIEKQKDGSFLVWRLE